MAFVSGNYFATLGTSVKIGRALGDADARTPGGEPVAVLSDQGWARLFDRDPDVLGRTVAFNQQFARLLGAGAAAGLVMAFSIMSLLRSMVVLQNVSFLDAASFAASLALVVVAGTIAAFFPAHPASRVDPALTLRSEG